MSWIIYAIIGAVVMALVSVIEKKTLIKEHAMKFSTVLAIFNVLVSLVYLPKVNFNISGNALFYIFLGSILGSIGFLFLAKGIRHTEVSLSSPLLNIGPGVTAILAFLFIGEAVTLWQVLGIVILIIGTYILESGNQAGLTKILEPFKKMIKSRYIHFIFFAIVLYGFSSIIDKKVLNMGIDKFSILFFIHIFIAINYLIMISIYYGGISDVIDGIKKSGKFIIIIAILITTARLLFLEAISIAYVSLVIPLKRLSTLFVTIFGGAFFHDHNLKLKIIGCIIMLLGVFFVAFPF